MKRTNTAHNCADGLMKSMRHQLHYCHNDYILEKIILQYAAAYSLQPHNKASKSIIYILYVLLNMRGRGGRALYVGVQGCVQQVHSTLENYIITLFHPSLNQYTSAL